MASQRNVEQSPADRWIAAYRAAAPPGDLLAAGDPAWRTAIDELASLGDLATAYERVQAQAAEIGAGYRLTGDEVERPWPLSPVPIMIEEGEWSGIARAIEQRAQLMEMLLADIHGPQKLVQSGHLPAALIAGSPFFLRPMLGLKPPGGHHLHFYAADLARGPTGEWRVLADHTRTPTGAGYALENRLAMSRCVGGLQARLNIERLAPFFAAFRDGLAAASSRADPRIALLTPGRFNQSYAEQAHLARYLGLLLVEGEDLAAVDDRLYVRTIAGLKRIDALWRRVDPRLLDPLAFDSGSAIGVPGLIDAMAAGNVVIANAPGAGVLESPAFAGFLPRLMLRVLNEGMAMPNIATWWCGQESERAHVEANLDSLLIAPAFGANPLGLPGGAMLGAEIAGAARDRLRADMARRPQDYVGQEVVALSTTPAVIDGALQPRPFTLRVFAARNRRGRWMVMPGGFARLGDSADIRAPVMGAGAFSADVCVHGSAPVSQLSLLAPSASIRRNPGTLPSRVADNLYWLGRYLERGEAVLALVRAAASGPPDDPVTSRVANLLIASGAAAKRAPATAAQLAAAALDNADEAQSICTLLALARSIGEGSRERLSADVWRLLDAQTPPTDGINALQERFAALAGLAAEHMARTDAWRFHDLGRRIERAVSVCRLLRAFAGERAGGDELTILLELAGSQISYRQRYLTGLALGPVRDLIALDPHNPRSLAFQVDAVTAHLAALPALRDDGMAEEQAALAAALKAVIATTTAETLGEDALQAIEHRLLALSDAIARRFFLRGGEALRGAGLTLA